MNRENKISTGDVYNLILNDFNTKQQIADKLDCSVATIESRIRELRKEGEVIIHSSEGLRLLSSESILRDDPELAKLLDKNIRWVVAILKGMQVILSTSMPFLPTVKIALKHEYSSSERKIFTKRLVALTHLLTTLSVIEDIDNAMTIDDIIEDLGENYE